MNTINSRKKIDEDLTVLKRMVFRMGRMAGDALEKSVWALKNRDEDAARQIIADDDMIDDLEEKVDGGCMEFAAMYQPLAGDLREITSLMHIAVDIERIGDYGENIAKTTIEFSTKKTIKPLIDIPRMAEHTNRMLEIALTAIDTRSPELAMTVFPLDDELDDMDKQVTRELFLMCMEKTERIEQSFMLMNVSRTLERAGDHVTNIAEKAAYMYTGKPIRASQYRRKR